MTISRKQTANKQDNKSGSENRFRAMASKGDKKRGLELLKKLQDHYGDEANP